MTSGRVDWVDYAKGICIVLVVMMQVTLTYGDYVQQEGWLHYVVLFAQPFRMPDFFLISGLFLARSIHAPLRDYLDRKVLHFAYFYVLWLAIQLSVIEVRLLLTDPAAFTGLFTAALVEPINTLWFVHMLAIFYIVTRLVRHVPALLVFAAAAAVHTAYVARVIDSNSIVLDQFANRYVYFFAGYAAAPWIFALAREAAQRPRLAVPALVAWAVGNGWMAARGLHLDPLFSLITGFAGAGAIVAIGSLLSGRQWAWPLRHAGANSIVVYLTYFLPMAVLIKLLIATGWIGNVGHASLAITAAAVVSPLVFHAFIRNTPLAFLYVRPPALRMTSRSDDAGRASVAGGMAGVAVPDPAFPRASE